MMKFRNIVFWIHLISGVIIGAVVMSMSVTGTIIAFEPQIVLLAERSIRKVSTDDHQQPLSLSRVVDSAVEDRNGKRPSSISIDSDPGSSIAVNFGKKGGTMFVNPFDGTVLGKDSKIHNFLKVVENWHRWFTVRDIGRPVTGACNAVFCVMIISGIIIWWPRSWKWSGLKKRVLFNRTAGGQARDWNWHTVIGFWLAPVLLVTSLTGMVMSYRWANDFVYRAAGSKPPVPREGNRTKSGDRANVDGKNNTMNQSTTGDQLQTEYDLDLIMQNAKLKVDNWKSIRLDFPNEKNKEFTAVIEESVPWHPSPRSTLKLDAQTGEELSWESYKHIDRGRKWRSWVKLIHTGQAFGLIGQSIMFIGAIGAMVLVWTGLSMAWRRFVRSRSKSRQ